MDQPTSYGVSAPATVSFHGAQAGQWSVTHQSSWIGDGLPHAPAIAIGPSVQGAVWSLTGFTSNLRYTTRAERGSLDARSAPLGRQSATLAALIPIRKSQAWWSLAQNERRAIYARSAHTPIGLRYLPQVARRLHHSRDLGEPFDFLTWFEYSADDAAAFDELLERLRRSEEWRYVEREVDIRLIRSR